MGMKIVFTVIVIVCILFFLSVCAPVRSQKRFWVAINKIRDVMDIVVYWFFNACGIAAILYVVYMSAKGLLSI